MRGRTPANFFLAPKNDVAMLPFMRSLPLRVRIFLRRPPPCRLLTTAVTLAVGLSGGMSVHAKGEPGRCEQCLTACAATGSTAYPPEDRPMRPPDDVHHESRRGQSLFNDARSLDPAFGGKSLDEAIAGYRGAARLDPRNAEYRNHLAAALMRRGQYDEARYNLAKAIEVAPSHAKYYVNLGYVHHKLGDEVRAMAAFMRAVALDPRNTKARLFAAHAFRALGLKDEARAEYARVLALDSTHKGAKRGLASVQPPH